MTAAIRLFDESTLGHSLTVAECVRLYLGTKDLQHKSGTYSAKRLEKTKFYLASFTELYGTQTVEQCRNLDLARWLSDHPEWASPHTLTDAAGSVVGAFRWAKDESYIHDNPYHRPKIPTPRPRNAIDPGEVRGILSAARACNGKRGKRRNPSCRAFRLALWFLWESGARTCEMRELEWSFVDWDRGVAVFTHHKTDRTGVDRIIPLTDRALRLLRWLKRRATMKQRFVFANGRGRQWTAGTFAKQFGKYRKLAQVRDGVSPYSTRHGFTVEALENGVGEQQLAGILGQATTRLISWYGRGARTKTDYLRANAEQAKGRKKKGADE
jgi:integrase